LSFLTERGSLRGLARWLFFATLILAPWLYGGTTAWAIELIVVMLGVTLTVWIASLLVDRRWPVLPRSLMIIAALILLQGWWMVLNAHAIYDASFRAFVPLGSIVPSLPGSTDYVLSLASMLRATILIGAIFLVVDIAQRPPWLLRLWYVLAISGGSIALFGLLQKATSAQMIFWLAAEPWETKTFFATYYYHANAGAFLNLALPVAAGLALWTVARRARPFARMVWATTLLLVMLAALSNTSRMAQAVGLLIVLALVGAVVRPTARMVARAEKWQLLIGLFVVVLTTVAIAQAAHLDKPLERWHQLTKQLPVDERWAANRAALDAVGDAALFGFGPGTFRSIFPHYQVASTSHPHGTWRFLHDDYLQTILEWGWIGSIFIAALFFGGAGIAIRNYFRAEGWSNRQRILLPCVVLALAGVAIHALVDFPLQILSIQLLVATYLGVCWGSSGWELESRKSKVESRK
jgi:O-antigen ligase/polysaccharide polymerase Wzy-like membrane protein